MYMKDFLYSLDMLRRPEFLNPAIYWQAPGEDIICFGYELDKTSGGDPVCLLRYCLKEDCLNSKVIDITGPWK